MLDSYSISFKDYLRLSKRSQKNPVIIEEYDDFILKIWTFFDLRATAEDNFKKHPHLAKNNRGALPLTWQQIADRLNDSGPPVNIVSQIAKLRYNDVEFIIGNLRKVLSRVRGKETIGRVQQVDSHCLRWLTRQPGRTAIEKAGLRQEILAVTRIENYDTLENRVLKDFLLRSASAASFYLRKYAHRYPDHLLTKLVTKFNNLCLTGLSLPVMREIRMLHDLPQPNYVLQQDVRYSKIWNDYCKLIRQDEIAELLWKKHKSCDDYFSKCLKYLPLHCSPCAKYQIPLWFNELDGKCDILDYPCWENEECESIVCDCIPPQNELVVVDLTSPWDGRKELVYGVHNNAKPFIQNPHKPNNEQYMEIVSLEETIRRGRVDGNMQYLQDYFEQLYGLLGGNEWVVLVPDLWDAQWLEMVKRCCPMSLRCVFLLWRSVAAVLGCGELWRGFADGNSIVVADGYGKSDFVATKLIFKKDIDSGRVLPQRASYRLHKDTRFVVGTIESHGKAMESILCGVQGIICMGYLTSTNLQFSGDVWCATPEKLKSGVEKFHDDLDKKIVTYFDELDAFTLIRTNKNEEIERAILIEHKESWPGGCPYQTKEQIYVGTLAAGESKMSLYMYEGIPEANSKLKLYEQEFASKTDEAEQILIDAKLTPGQGLAVITIYASFLECGSVELALHDKTKLLDSQTTILKIEKEYKRHFPPTMPLVDANPVAWHLVEKDVNLYLSNKSYELAQNLFYKPQFYYTEEDNQLQLPTLRSYGKPRQFDPENMSPIERLKRENVFGNNPENRLPDKNTDFQELFRRLVSDYLHGRNSLRLLSWTYQYDNPELEPIREELFRKYMTTGKLDPLEISFCCNNFADNDKRIGELLIKAFEHIIAGKQDDEEFRLVYNLLQFHPSSIRSCESQLCLETMQAIMKFYNGYKFYSPWGMWGGANATKMAGYLIKCMLFILHRRRFDDNFVALKCEWKPKPSCQFAQSLPTHTESLRAHEQTRRAFIEYVNGRGTLEGIPNE